MQTKIGRYSPATLKNFMSIRAGIIEPRQLAETNLRQNIAYVEQ
jgi:hypothetical protein